MSKLKYSDDDLIQILKDVANELGRTPNQKDFYNRTPGATTFRRFGGWADVLKKADMKKEKEKSSDYTKEYMIKCLFEYYEKTGKIPTSRGMRSLGYPTIHAYINHFGSFKNALIETGLFELRNDKHQFCKEYTDEELFNALKDYMKNKTRIPVHSVMTAELTPSVSTYNRRFGSIFSVLKLIGYDYEKQNEEDLIELEKDMIEKYKELRQILGRVPSSRDIDKYSNKHKFGYSMSSYEFHFGSLSELQVLCGFIPTVIGRIKSKNDLLEDLKMMANELGKTPSLLDLKYFNSVAGAHKYAKEFGSWNDAIKESGLKPNTDVYYSSTGIICLSYYELMFTNMLETYNVKFLKEEFYKDYLPTDRKFRFDFVIEFNNQQYFIEVFGITSNDTYKERTQLKIQLCKENNLDLIEIYPEDFTSYKLEEIHKMLLSKLI